jgi:hypothetical protein
MPRIALDRMDTRAINEAAHATLPAPCPSPEIVAADVEYYQFVRLPSPQRQQQRPPPAPGMTAPAPLKLVIPEFACELAPEPNLIGVTREQHELLIQCRPRLSRNRRKLAEVALQQVLAVRIGQVAQPCIDHP